MKAAFLPLALLVLGVALPGQTPPTRQSPAEQQMGRAERAIQKDPQNQRAYNDLALALARRARETSDPACYTKAQQVLEKSFALAPENFEGQKIRVWVLLGKHEFAAALDQAKVLNRRVPDDVQVYGFLVDAHAELGNYEEAEKAAQWMLDLRPGNIAGLTRAAYLRELFGDVDGALELMHQAYNQTPPNEVEDRAWLLAQVGHLYLMTGSLQNAEKVLQLALEQFPAYHYALGNLAQARIGQEKYDEAIDLLRQRYEMAPHPENLYELARALERAQRRQEAEQAYKKFEQLARREMEQADNANRELIFYYAHRKRNPGEALRVARLEIGRRRDVYTLDAHAWALYRNGKYEEARQQIEKALAVGIKDAKLFYHAGVIAAGQKDHAQAEFYFRRSLQVNPTSEFAAAVQARLSGAASSRTSTSRKR